MVHSDTSECTINVLFPFCRVRSCLNKKKSSKMKLSRVIPVLVLGLGLLFSTTSCLVVRDGHGRHDNGRHRGWFKSSHKVHHPRSHKTYKSNKHFDNNSKHRK